MKKTGLKDRNGQDIFENEIILVGMRRDDARGWTEEMVIRKNPMKWWKPWEKPIWILSNQIGEEMEMQTDQQLRQKLSRI